jgi:hypothetical protein
MYLPRMGYVRGVHFYTVVSISISNPTTTTGDLENYENYLVEVD